jgi:hypothetical protein
MKTQFTNDQINAVMEKRGCTRKAALRWLNREDRPKGKAAAPPAKDVKKAAANDNTEAVPAEPKSEAGATPAVDHAICWVTTSSCRESYLPSKDNCGGSSSPLKIPLWHSW